MFHYYLFNKPYHVLSQFSREGDKQTLADYFPGLEKSVYPVGRLDYDSEGLLLLTDDRSLTHKLLDPAFAHERTYYVQVEGVVTDEALQQLANGVTITVDGRPHRTKKAKAMRIDDPQLWDRTPPIRARKNIPTSWLSLTLTEGKNRQVRKMTAAAGFPTLRLIRYSITNYTVEGIEPGKFRIV